MLGVLSVVMALGLESAKPFAVEGIFAALRSWSPFRAAAMAVLAVVAVGYSLTAELSLMAASRADVAAQRSQASDTVAAAKARYHVAQRELDALPMTRPVATLNAEIERLKTTPKLAPCEDTTARGYGPVTRRVCAEIATLTAEAATTARRDQLQVALHDAGRDLAAAPPATKADPAASALSTYLAAVGVPVEPGTLSEWLALVPVLALEVGSALAVILARGTPTHQAPAPAQSAAVPGTSHRETAADDEDGTPASTTGLKAALLEHLEVHGGGGGPQWPAVSRQGTRHEYHRVAPNHSFPGGGWRHRHERRAFRDRASPCVVSARSALHEPEGRNKKNTEARPLTRTFPQRFGCSSVSHL